MSLVRQSGSITAQTKGYGIYRGGEKENGGLRVKRSAIKWKKED